MTAVVGILNKQAIAVAADSAVTISGSNGRKMYPLSKDTILIYYRQKPAFNP